MELKFFAATDIGRQRDHNEDNYLVDKKLALFVVADGMGGHAAGEVASALAVRTVHEEVRKQRQLIEDFDQGATGASNDVNRQSHPAPSRDDQRPTVRTHVAPGLRA